MTNAKDLIDEYKVKNNKVTAVKRKVRCVETGEVWKNTNQAAKELNIYQSGIYNCCVGRAVSTFGLHFEFVTDEEER